MRILILSGVFAFSAAIAEAEPVYDGDNMLRPTDLERWVFVGSNLGLAYKDETQFMTPREDARQGAEMFHNVYMEPTSYASFMDTGEFPDKTMFAFEVYTADTKEEDPSNELNGGFFNGVIQSVEVSVKDKERMESGITTQEWAYYAYGLENGEPVERASAMPDDTCFACHAAHTKFDNVWVQFYPRIRTRLGM